MTKTVESEQQTGTRIETVSTVPPQGSLRLERSRAMKAGAMASLAAGIMVLALAVLPRPAEAGFTCGGTVGPGGTLVMSNDIKQCGSTVVLTVVGPVTVDMAGHAVGCSGPHNGINIIGHSAVVKNGVVLDCDQGVILSGAGSHQVRDMVAADNSNYSFLVFSDHNTLSSSTAAQSFGDGFRVVGKSNVISGNTASGNGGDGYGFSVLSGANLNQLTGNTATRHMSGFYNQGDHNKFTDNVAVANGAGFEFVAGTTNQLTNNIASDNGGAGIFIDEQGDTLTGNRAHLNGFQGILVVDGAAHNIVTSNIALWNFDFDLQDDNTACGTDTWTKNLGRKSAACIH